MDPTFFRPVRLIWMRFLRGPMTCMIFSFYLVSVGLVELGERTYAYPMNFALLHADGRDLEELVSLVLRFHEIGESRFIANYFDEAMVILTLPDSSLQVMFKDTQFPELGMLYALLEGRPIQTLEECMVGREWAEAAGLSLGDQVMILDREYCIVGITHHSHKESGMPAPVLVIAAANLESVLLSCPLLNVTDSAYQYEGVLIFRSIRSLEKHLGSIVQNAPEFEFESYPAQSAGNLSNREAMGFSLFELSLFLFLLISLVLLRQLEDSISYLGSLLLLCIVGFAFAWLTFCAAEAVIERTLSLEWGRHLLSAVAASGLAFLISSSWKHVHQES